MGVSIRVLCRKAVDGGRCSFGAQMCAVELRQYAVDDQHEGNGDIKPRNQIWDNSILPLSESDEMSCVEEEQGGTEGG